MVMAEEGIEAQTAKNTSEVKNIQKRLAENQLMMQNRLGDLTEELEGTKKRTQETTELINYTTKYQLMSMIQEPSSSKNSLKS